MITRISIFGAGRVGSALYDLFKSHHLNVRLISSRPGLAYDFAKSNLTDSDLVFITCPSAVIGQLSSNLASTNAMFVHCSGGDNLDLLVPEKRGVFYPLQSFSGQTIDWSSIPIFIQGNKDVEIELVKLAKACNLKYKISSDDERAKAHLAAVFANNFTNAMLHASKEVLGELPLEYLLPLIKETMNKAITGVPIEKSKQDQQ